MQSFDDDELRLMNRRHTGAQAVEAVRRAQAAGFANLTIDLIFGVPGFGGKVLQRNLEQALALGVQHISAYHLTVEKNTAFGRRLERGRFSEVDEQVSEREYLEVHRTLTGAGFEHYEVSNYALPGCRARHNAAYWSGDEYLGIGPAAHSFNGKSRRWAAASIDGYLAGAGTEAIYEQERLTERDRYNEYLMTRLRTAEDSSWLRSKLVSEKSGRSGCCGRRSLSWGSESCVSRPADWRFRRRSSWCRMP